MAEYLLDTNVLSEVIKKHPSPAVMTRLRAADQRSLRVSSVSVMELRYGAVRIPGNPKLWDRITDEVLSRVKVLPFDEEEAARAGSILADLEARGALIGVEDVMIAATALIANLTVVTRNIRHLGRIPQLVVENWWDE